MRKSGNRFSARIPLQTLGLNHVHDLGWNQSKINRDPVESLMVSICMFSRMISVKKSATSWDHAFTSKRQCLVGVLMAIRFALVCARSVFDRGSSFETFRPCFH